MAHLLQNAKVRSTLLVRSDRAGLVVVDVENGVELGQLQKVIHLLAEAKQLESRALVARRGEGTYQLAQARAVDVVDLAQIQQDAFLTLADEVANGVAQLYAAFTQCDPAAEVQNG